MMNLILQGEEDQEVVQEVVQEEEDQEVVQEAEEEDQVVKGKKWTRKQKRET